MTTPALPPPGFAMIDAQFGRVPYDVLTQGGLISAKPAATKIYVLLCAHADIDWKSRVGVRTLVRESGYQPATVCEAIQQLRGLGLIQTNEPKNGQAYVHTISTSPMTGTSDRLADTKRSTVQQPLNGQETDRLAATGPTVQQPPANRLVGAKRNREQIRNRPPDKAVVVGLLNKFGIRQAEPLAAHPGVTAPLVRQVAERLGPSADPAVLHNAIQDAAQKATADARQQKAHGRYLDDQAQQRTREREAEVSREREYQVDHTHALEVIAKLGDDRLTELRDAYVAARPPFERKPHRVPSLETLRTGNGGPGLRFQRVEIAKLSGPDGSRNRSLVVALAGGDE